MLNKSLAVFLFVFVSLSVNSQKYKKSTESFDFSFTKDGKMKVEMKPNQTIMGNKSKTIIAEKEMILFQDRYSGIWTIYGDGKIGDSLVQFEWGSPHKHSICFVKKDGQLIYSENTLIHDEPLMQINPDTQESEEVYDEMGNPMYDYSVSGGLVERINLKDGKSVFKKEGYSLLNIYGDRLLLVKITAADGTLWNKMSLTDWTGKMYFEDKSVKDIYSNNEYLSLLVNQTKAEKIIIKNENEYFDNFGFLANGKMGYSSIFRGVITEPDKDFQIVGGMKFFYENNLLKAKMPESEKILEGKESIQSMFYAHDYYTEYFVDKKLFNIESGGVYGTWAPAFASAETFVKIGNHLIYSKPYVAPPDYSFDYVYQPTESELGSLVIYDLSKKDIIFNANGYSLLNHTEKGYLVKRLELEMVEGYSTGKIMESYYIMNKSGEMRTDQISQQQFSNDSYFLLSLLPDGAKEVSREFNYMGNTLIYSLKGKVGMIGEYNTVDRAPEMKWRMAFAQGDFVIMDNQLLTPDDTLDFKGDKPYCDKNILGGYRSYSVFGDKRKMNDMITGENLDFTEPIEFSLTDTNYVLESIEFKKNIVIQNISGEVRAYEQSDYDYETGNQIFKTTLTGETLMAMNIESKSGVFDREKEKWIVPAQYFRLIPTDKYYVASYYHFDVDVELTRPIFEKAIANMKFDVYDLSGNKVISGNSADVKKKTGVDVNTLVYKY